MQRTPWNGTINSWSPVQMNDDWSVRREIDQKGLLHERAKVREEMNRLSLRRLRTQIVFSSSSVFSPLSHNKRRSSRSSQRRRLTAVPANEFFPHSESIMIFTRIFDPCSTRGIFEKQSRKLSHSFLVCNPTGINFRSDSRVYVSTTRSTNLITCSVFPGAAQRGAARRLP